MNHIKGVNKNIILEVCHGLRALLIHNFELTAFFAKMCKLGDNLSNLGFESLVNSEGYKIIRFSLRALLIQKKEKGDVPWQRFIVKTEIMF